MNKQQEALKLALEALEQYEKAGLSTLKTIDAIVSLREALADSALERMAENARELGLDYEPIVEQVEDFVGMGHGAWDMVDPKELAKGFHEALAEPPCKTGSQCTNKCQQCEQPAQQHYQSTADKCELTPVPAKGGLLPAQQQEPVSAIRALTDQCAALIQERDELQKQVWRYEKNGVTCQTYRHKIDRTCSECNVQEDYTSPQPAQQQSLQDLWHKVWPEAGAFVRASADDLTQFAKAVSTSPPASKPWVPLTEFDIDQIPYSCSHADSRLIAFAIEAKLKEKNA